MRNEKPFKAFSFKSYYYCRCLFKWPLQGSLQVKLGSSKASKEKPLGIAVERFFYTPVALPVSPNQQCRSSK